MIGFNETLLLIWKKQTNFWNKNDMKTLIKWIELLKITRGVR